MKIVKKSSRNVFSYLLGIADYAYDNPTRVAFMIFFIYGIGLRILNFTYYTNIYHPDEIFQSLEPAHQLVFGYAYLPPEFRSSVPGSDYYGRARSWLFPLIFAIPMYLMSRMGFDYHTQILPSLYFIGVISSILMILSARYFLTVYSGNKKIGDVGAVFLSVTPHIAYATSRLTTNTLLLPLLFFALAKAVQIHRGDRGKNSSRRIKLWEGITLVFGLGVVTYIRMDLLIIITGVSIAELISLDKGRFRINRPKSYNNFLIQGAIGWILGMLVDYRLYNSSSLTDLWQVPYNWFGFNFIEQGSRNFGVSVFGYYYLTTISMDGSWIWIFLSSIILMVVFIVEWYYRESIDPMIISRCAKMVDSAMEFLRLSSVLFFTWIIYEWPFENGINFYATSHKETRFIINVLILYRLFMAFSFYLAIEALDLFFTFREYRKSTVSISRIGITPLYVKIMAVSLMIFISIPMITANERILEPYEQYGDTNNALRWIGQQDDVRGVIVLVNWFYSGGYTYLHQNVSMVFIGNVEETLYLQNAFKSSAYNYALVPKFTYGKNSGLFNLMRENGWVIANVVDGSSEVWVRY